jgi:branched-chain amino acid transport system permease protein
MFYREAGQFKTSYEADQSILPIFQDRIAMYIMLMFAFIVFPFIANDYWLGSILIPFLVLSLAALGLNVLTGYAGQISLGSAAFMAVGAFAAFNLHVRIPEIPFLVVFLWGGLCSAAVGMIFGLPSLRIKGFYLAVATLAAQFFIEWLFTHFDWFTNYSTSGVITAPPMHIFGFAIDNPLSKYFVVLTIVVLCAFGIRNLARSEIGRAWMAVRDMDIAAEAIGINLMKTKLLAFGVSSFLCGLAGALWAYAVLGTVEPQAFDIIRSFEILFMIIIGGLGSVSGAFLGAGFIVLLPILLNNLGSLVTGGAISTETIAHIEYMIFGAFIVFFLIVEPNGLARLWQIGKEKLRLWPFPY